MTPELKNKILRGCSTGGQLHAILACVLGEGIPAPHYYGKASVTSDGFVMCSFVDRNGEGHSGAFVGSMGDLERNLDGLASFLHLSVAERDALWQAVEGWIAVDYRSRRRVH